MPAASTSPSAASPAACARTGAAGRPPRPTPVRDGAGRAPPMATGPSAPRAATKPMPGWATRPGTSAGQRASISSRVSRSGSGHVDQPEVAAAEHDQLGVRLGRPRAELLARPGAGRLLTPDPPARRGPPAPSRPAPTPRCCPRRPSCRMGQGPAQLAELDAVAGRERLPLATGRGRSAHEVVAARGPLRRPSRAPPAPGRGRRARRATRPGWRRRGGRSRRSRRSRRRCCGRRASSPRSPPRC